MNVKELKALLAAPSMRDDTEVVICGSSGRGGFVAIAPRVMSLLPANAYGRRYPAEQDPERGEFALVLVAKENG